MFFRESVVGKDAEGKREREREREGGRERWRCEKASAVSKKK